MDSRIEHRDTLIRWLGRFGTLCGDQLSFQLLEYLRCFFWLRSGTFDCEQ